MSIADPSIGLITAKALNINNIVMLIKGNNILLFLKPGIDNVLLVDNKFISDIVVLIPAKYTPKTNMSCIPTPVYLILEEKGVIKVHPATV